MQTIQVNIINPQAINLINELVALKLIEIVKSEESSNHFSELANSIRSNSIDELTLDEITNEVEEVRANRYDK